MKSNLIKQASVKKSFLGLFLKRDLCSLDSRLNFIISLSSGILLNRQGFATKIFIVSILQIVSFGEVNFFCLEWNLLLKSHPCESNH